MERYCTQTIKVNFPNKIFLGSEYVVHVPFYSGDAVSKIRVVLNLPSSNTLFEKIIQEAEILNTNEILYGEFMYIENTINTNLEKQAKYESLVSGQKIYIDLPFYSIKKIFFNKINLRILFGVISNITTELDGYLLVDYVVTDKLPKFPYFQRVRQVQKLPVTVSNSEYVTIDAYITGPVYELFFTVRDTSTNTYVDAIDNVTFFMNEIERFNLSGYYLRYIEPLKRRKSASMDVPIYNYSFCIDPLNYKIPTGQTHFSENQRFKIKLFKNKSTYEIVIWAVSHNFYYSKSKDDDVKPVFASGEMVLNSVSDGNFNFINVPSLKVSYINVNNVISVTYSSNVEISNVNVVSSNVSTYTITQNEINYNKISSISKSYYSNVIFTASGYKDTQCNFVFNGSEIMKNFIQKEEGPYYFFISGDPIVKIDGGQRFNIASNYTLNNTNLGIGTIRDFYIDQYKNFIVKTDSSIIKYDQTLSTVLYSFTISSVSVGDISSYFETDIIPFYLTSTSGTISGVSLNGTYQGVVYNTSTNKYNTIYCSNSQVTIHSAKIDEKLNTYISGVTTGTGNIVVSSYTITNGTGKKAFMIKFNSSGVYEYSIICDNSNDGVKTNVDVITSNNIVIFTCYSTTSSTLYDYSTSYSSISSSNTLNSFLINSSTGMYTNKNMKIENFTSLPLLNKCFLDVYNNYYVSYSGTNTSTYYSGFVIQKFDKFTNSRYYLTFKGNETCNVFFEPVTTNVYITCKNSTGSRDLMNVFSNGTQILATNVPSSKNIILCFDSSGSYINYSTPTSNIIDLVTTEKIPYFTPFYDSSYFSNTYSQQFSYENYLWNTFVTNATIKDIYVKNSNVYVCGTSGPSSSNVYDTTGLSSNIVNQASNIGNMYVVKYNSNGNSQWTTRCSPFNTTLLVSVTSDSNDNVFATGQNWSGGGDLYFYDKDNIQYSKSIQDQQGFLIKYTPSGTIDWVSNIYGQYGTQILSQFTRTDYQSNVYVLCSHPSYDYNLTAYSSDGTTNVQSDPGSMILCKYTTSGTPLWVSSFSGNGNGCGSISVDPSDNSVYASGLRYNSGGGTTVKTKPTSNILNYSTVSRDSAYIVKYDSTGNGLFLVYVSNPSIGLNFAARTVSTLVDSSSNFYMCSSYGSDDAPPINANVYNPNNSLSPVWITGTTVATDRVGFAVKFNSSGIAQWAVSINGVNIDEAKSIMSDSSNNVYIAGFKTTSQSNIYNAGNTVSSITIPVTQSSTAFLVKFNSSGIAQWVIYIDGQLDDASYALSRDNSGNILFGGYYSGSNVKIYESNGGTYNLIKSNIGGNNVAFCIKIDSNGFIVPI